MPLGVLKDAPVKGTRRRGRSLIMANTSNWRVGFARVAFALVTASAAATALLLLFISISEKSRLYCVAKSLNI